MAEHDKDLAARFFSAGAASAGPRELTAEEREASDKAAQAARKKRKKGYVEGKPELSINSLMDIFTNILVYLILNFNSEPVTITMGPDLQLPKSTTTIHPEAAVPVTITKSTVLVNNEMLFPISNLKIPAAQKEGGDESQYLIPKLRDKLKEHMEWQKEIAASNPNFEFKGFVTLIADEQMPYRMLMELLYSSGQAEFNQFKFAVIKKKG